MSTESTIRTTVEMEGIPIMRLYVNGTEVTHKPYPVVDWSPIRVTVKPSTLYLELQCGPLVGGEDLTSDPLPKGV